MSQENRASALSRALAQAEACSPDLGEQLSAFARLARDIDPDTAAMVDRLATRLASNGVGRGAPDVGEYMPDFLLPDPEGRLMSLGALTSSKASVIVFQRGHWCPFCGLTRRALSGVGDEIRRLGANLVIITPERHEFTKQMQDARSEVVVLSDMDNAYALSIGLAIWVGDEIRRAMEAAGRQLPLYNGNESWTLPIPATFIVDRERKIRARHLDLDYRRRMSPASILAVLATIEG
ncbi:MAG: peroxiredoxin-like family protein [Hyphomicrobiaceae bacterium]